MTDEKVSFLKCLIHEAKPAYKSYITWLVGGGSMLALLALVSWGLTTYGPALGAEASLIVGVVISIVWAILVFIPWWAYVIVGIACPPLLYASVVCIKKRYDVDLFPALILIGISYGLGIMMGVILHAAWGLSLTETAIATVGAGTVLLVVMIGVLLDNASGGDCYYDY